MKLLRDGKDALVISSGFLTMRALEAVEKLRVEAARAALTEASQGLSERLAPKAKAALEALPAK